LRDYIFQFLNSGHATEKMWSHTPYIWLTRIFQSGTNGVHIKGVYQSLFYLYILLGWPIC